MDYNFEGKKQVDFRWSTYGFDSKLWDDFTAAAQKMEVTKAKFVRMAVAEMIQKVNHEEAK